ncbi:MAG: hypothetical protein AABY63_08720 [candidate division NC10 bacterium]
MNAPGLGTVLAPSELLAQYRFLDPVRVDNPLAQYPNLDWERMYRDIFRHDRTFSFLCAPNDTHNCLLKGFVKNNVLVRIEPTCGYKGSLQGVWLQGARGGGQECPPQMGGVQLHLLPQLRGRAPRRYVRLTVFLVNGDEHEVWITA